MFTTIKKIILFGIIGIAALAAFIFFCNYWLVSANQSNIFSEAKAIPSNDVALVLGTNPLVRGKYVNPYFTTRIDAAVDLFQNQKIKHIIVSGDNGKQKYDEPTAMRDSLIARGIPEAAITLDYAGFRTLDSVVRCKKVFQQDEITIISQEFHNYRALQIAKRHGINAVAYNARKPFAGVRTKPEYREYLARCKAVVDLYILNKAPKFLGEKITIDL